MSKKETKLMLTITEEIKRLFNELTKDNKCHIYTKSIFEYVRRKPYFDVDSNDGEIDITSEHAVIMAYIKYLEKELGI